MRKIVFLLLALAFVFAPPWYFPSEVTGFMWGFPHWSWAVIALSAAVSLMVAYLLSQKWPEEEDEGV